ncbi:putative transcription factor bHLH107 [Tasmannia lanceolata]|uniref:putative transcription factor bHLH107 n=1 Tax=Tasmannia lanceolata TaxID=3420 RepID=UPI0040639970
MTMVLKRERFQQISWGKDLTPYLFSLVYEHVSTLRLKMLPFQSYYGLQSGENFFQGFGGAMEMERGVSNLSLRSKEQEREMSPSEKHRQAERKRRDRINAHLNTLRTLLPTTTQTTDKASVLAAVVPRVKELKRNAADVASNESQGSMSPIPTETDEVKLESDPDSSLIKASICCDERPDLFSKITTALRSLQLKAVKADIATIRSRTKIILLIKGSEKEASPNIFPALRRALKTVMGKTGALGPLVLQNKRLRLSTQLTQQPLFNLK